MKDCANRDVPDGMSTTKVVLHAFCSLLGNNCHFSVVTKETGLVISNDCNAVSRPFWCALCS